MKKLLILVLLLACLTGIVYADISPFPVMLFAGVAFLVVLLLAFVGTVAVELVTSLLYLHFRKLSKWILLSAILSNIISVPLFWIFVVIVSWYVDYWIPVAVGEIMVFAFEATVIFLLNRKRMKLNDAVAMSLINNLASFLVGLGFFLLFRTAL
ncbi:MAG: hypothetical protein Sv326_1077 [Candidatus Fermentimicrarchaeum limneticum]|uniref:Uncharacterized protein n=1 Tax=Fermentimicrarchaeum limneticum TaxID=2795018 RepID=A0A7D5XI87_FERL1|nr:MAG: hypothetical protein Sv326_1077 [Candidatus Fermentimicrarchaeum limneticum]